MFQLFSGRSKRSRKSHRPSSRKRSKLALEHLEDRRVFAVATPTLAGGLLTINADSGAPDKVEVRQNDERNFLEVRVNDLPVDIRSNGTLVSSVPSSAVTTINANLGAGNDTFDYRLLSNVTRVAKTVIANLGSNDDFFNFYGTNFEIGEDLTLDVTAGNGNDTFWANPGDVDDNVKFTVTTHLGNGDDRFAFFLNGDIDDSANVKVDVFGEVGDDRLSFHADNDVEIDSGAQLTVKLDGGEGVDILDFYYRGRNRGRLTRKLLGGNGFDYATDSVDPNLLVESEVSGIQQFLQPEIR